MLRHIFMRFFRDRAPRSADVSRLSSLSHYEYAYEKLADAELEGFMRAACAQRAGGAGARRQARGRRRSDAPATTPPPEALQQRSADRPCFAHAALPSATHLPLFVSAKRFAMALCVLTHAPRRRSMTFTPSRAIHAYYAASPVTAVV